MPLWHQVALASAILSGIIPLCKCVSVVSLLMSYMFVDTCYVLPFETVHSVGIKVMCQCQLSFCPALPCWISVGSGLWASASFHFVLPCLAGFLWYWVPVPVIILSCLALLAFCGIRVMCQCQLSFCPALPCWLSVVLGLCASASYHFVLPCLAGFLWD